MTLVPIETLIGELTDCDIKLEKYRDKLALSRGGFYAQCPGTQTPCNSGCLFFYLTKAQWDTNTIKVTISCRAITQHFLVELR